MKHFRIGDKLPEGVQLFKKNTVVEMVQIHEPFTCDNREAQAFRAQAGDFLVQDGHGGFYPVSAEFHAANYVPAEAGGTRNGVLAEVSAERDYQDEKFGGPSVDDRENGYMEWVTYIAHFSTRWFGGGFPPFSAETDSAFRRAMIKVAALAVAAIEQYDRKHIGDLGTANPLE